MDFTNEHHYAMTFAGTIALPSPYPATGRASFVLTDWDSEHVVYIKLIQVVNPRQIISRFVRPEDIRAIRPRPSAPTSDDPEEWPVLSPAKTREQIRAGEAAIVAHADAARLKYLEEPWHREVILYVPERAAVLHCHELGMTAAESAERLLHPMGVCCGG